MPVECLSAGILVVDHLCAPISHLPAAGELVLSEDLPLAMGGCASNTAVDLSRLGVKVGVIGCVGEDPFGRFMIDGLSRCGVETTGIRQLPNVPTSGTLIINVRGQDRRFIHTIGANAAFRAELLSVDEVAEARVFYVGGYLLMSGLDPAALARLFASVRARGVKTFLDVVVPGAGDHLSRLAPVLAETDVFHCNIDEGRAITGDADPARQADRFLAAGCGTALITLGGEGTLLATKRERLRAGTYPVTFVGGTGAGDAFDAGYIDGMLRGEEARGCLQRGSALGASCVRSIGATDSVFTRSELEQFLQQQTLRIDVL